MNNNQPYTSINDAYNIAHVNPHTYKKDVIYDNMCIFCSNLSSKSLMNDGGSFRNCNKCRKNFRAKILSVPVDNYVKSTLHLNGTN